MILLSCKNKTHKTPIMNKSYSECNKVVNSELFLSDPPIEAFDRCQSNVALRLARASIDFEKYRPQLEKAVLIGRIKRQLKKLGRKTDPLLSLFSDDQLGAGDASRLRLFKSSVGRPSLDSVLMFRVVFLATITHTSDAQMSCAILSDAITRLFTKVPPGTFISRQAIWDYREFFVESGVCETITNMHLEELRAQGLLTDDGAMILDGSFVEAPKQRNTREENKMIKEGRGNELWNDQPAKKRQKDIDARWTKKNDEVHFGYKIHALVDAVHKIMIYGVTTPANVHDSRALNWVLNAEEDKGRTLYADSAYCGEALEELTRSFNVIPCFCEKGYANHPLTDEQKENNRQKSKTRSRIEHVFGHIQTVFKGSFVRTIGLARATAYNWLIMLGYNICRQDFLCRQQE